MPRTGALWVALAAAAVLIAAVACAPGPAAAAEADAGRGVEWADAPTVKHLGARERLEAAREASRAVFVRGRPAAEAAPAAAAATAAPAPALGPEGARFAETDAATNRRGFLKSKTLKKLGKKLKKGFKKVTKLFKDPTQTNAQKVAAMRKDAKTGRPIHGEDLEDCVACQFVWRGVELDVGNTEVADDVYDSFSHQCIQAEKTKIFYPACEMMYEQVNDMIGDYLEGLSAVEMCSKAGLGCEGTYLPPRKVYKAQANVV